MKVWASGGGGVTAKTRAKAAKASAEWEAKKKAAKLDNKVKASNNDLVLYFSKSYNIDDVRKQYRNKYPYAPGNTESRWVREMWSDHMIVMIENNNGEESARFVKVPYTIKDGTAEFGEEKEVKQAFIDLSHSDLQTTLTDAQLEKAAMIPCTTKDNRSLVENINITKNLRKEQEDLLRFSADKPHLLKLIQEV